MMRPSVFVDAAVSSAETCSSCSPRLRSDSMSDEPPLGRSASSGCPLARFLSNGQEASGLWSLDGLHFSADVRRLRDADGRTVAAWRSHCGRIMQAVLLCHARSCLTGVALKGFGNDKRQTHLSWTLRSA